LKRKKEEAKKQRARSASETESGSGDSDFTDESSIYEKKLNLLQIPHILLWKTINSSKVVLQEGVLTGKDAVAFMLQASKKFILLATQYLVYNPTIKAVPSSSSFTTTLITYLNKVIIVDKQFFMTEIL